MQDQKPPLALLAVGMVNRTQRRLVMRVAIVENTEVTHLGQVGVALAEAGALIDIWRPWKDGGLPDQMGRYAGLVVLGGEQSALDDHTHPYLPRLATLMRSYADQGGPLLGICLGSQMLARAYGARNRLGSAREFGWHHVTPTEEGRADPLLEGLDAGFPIFQWHSDTFDLPTGGTRLAASGAVANQAFRVGRAAYGTQFHFEANRAVVQAWNRDFPDAVEARHPGWLDAFSDISARHAPAADATGLAIARAWTRLL
ncbi:type 1 glutamine amidotransferase [Defluviimonas sp. WL0002]|uniref:Type 1 glutamine amidotransferase n=1 Tax=Albidovulum marisflavi TaxID=2984159 RepID=A0ABT2ZHC1_9RHOB|nr:type 1 glutamine amidotransferase [Defluviimonas sp. WL0002]MCV2870530.1 type 1 glutamine amidotransferase [Defluviimonas sp. WL0002]